MPFCLDWSLEGAEWDIVVRAMANTDLEPCIAEDIGYVYSFVEAINLIVGAYYISRPAAYLFLALARKQVKDLVITLYVEQPFTIVTFNTELVACVKIIVVPANFKA